MALDAENFKSSELTISVEEQADGVVNVAWLGTSDARDPARELTPFLTGLAGRLAGKAVNVDFRRLEYMNSGTVSPIIQFARALDSSAGKTTLLYDTKVGWQRVNFVCLKNIAKTLSNVLVEG
jgi:hypothetical protein